MVTSLSLGKVDFFKYSQKLKILKSCKSLIIQLILGDINKPTPPPGSSWADEHVDVADGEFDRSRPAKYHRIPSKEEMKDFPYFPIRFEGEPQPDFDHRVFRFWKNYFLGQKRKELRAAKAASKAQNNPGSSQGVKRLRSVGNKSSQPDKRHNVQSATNVRNDPKGQPSRPRGTYANVAAMRNRGTAEPHKLFIHSIVDGDEKARRPGDVDQYQNTIACDLVRYGTHYEGENTHQGNLPRTQLRHRSSGGRFLEPMGERWSGTAR